MQGYALQGRRGEQRRDVFKQCVDEIEFCTEPPVQRGATAFRPLGYRVEGEIVEAASAISPQLASRIAASFALSRGRPRPRSNGSVISMTSDSGIAPPRVKQPSVHLAHF
ncbi:hypothetical protein BH10PSE12_BH10PSE12_17060 [soil metagenome]